MKLLLDTCTLIWFFSEPEKIPKNTLNIITEDSTEVFFSAISLGEIACAYERKKIELNVHWKTWSKKNILDSVWKELTVDSSVVIESNSLPEPIHRDPIDRILIAHARLQNLKLVTADRKIIEYPHVDVIWS